jgi:hypothetical protein
VYHQGGRNRATGQADGKVVAEAKQFVVPTLPDIDQRQMLEVGVLLMQQRSNEQWADRDFGGRFRPDRHVHSPGITASVGRIATAGRSAAWPGVICW